MATICPKCREKIPSTAIDRANNRVTCPQCLGSFRIKSNRTADVPKPATDTASDLSQFDFPDWDDIPVSSLPNSPIPSLPRPTAQQQQQPRVSKQSRDRSVAFVVAGIVAGCVSFVVVFVFVNRWFQSPSRESDAAPATKTVAALDVDHDDDDKAIALHSDGSPTAQSNEDVAVPTVRFSDEFLQSLVQFDADVKPLFGPAVCVDQIPEMPRSPGRRIPPAPTRSDWTEIPWQPRDVSTVEPEPNTGQSSDADTTGSGPPDRKANVVKAALPQDWRVPPISNATTWKWRPESLAKKTPLDFPQPENGFLLNAVVNVKPWMVFRADDPSIYQLRWGRVDFDSGEMDDSIVVDPQPFSATMNPRLDYIPHLRADISPDNSKICFTKIGQRFSKLIVGNASGERLAEFSPYGPGISVDEVRWYAEDRLLTLGQGRCTIWKWPELTVVTDVDGNYRSPVAVSSCGRWCTVCAGSWMELLEIETGTCLGCCWSPTEADFSDVHISPNGQWMATTHRMPSRSTPEGPYRWWTFVWDLANRRVGQIVNCDYIELDQTGAANPCANPKARWINNENLVVIGRSVILVNPVREELTNITLMSGQHLVLGSKVNAFVATLGDGVVGGEVTVPGVNTLQVCVGLPKQKHSQFIAERYAQMLQSLGRKIGPGGDTVYITAGSDDNGITLKAKNSVAAYITTPRVIYAITMIAPDGTIIYRRDSKGGRFLEDKSRYFTNVGAGKLLFSSIEYYQFPSDYRQAIINEILELGVGIVPRELPKGETELDLFAERIPIDWSPIPLDGVAPK